MQISARPSWYTWDAPQNLFGIYSYTCFGFHVSRFKFRPSMLLACMLLSHLSSNKNPHSWKIDKNRCYSVIPPAKTAEGSTQRWCMLTGYWLLKWQVDLIHGPYSCIFAAHPLFNLWHLHPFFHWCPERCAMWSLGVFPVSRMLEFLRYEMSKCQQVRLGQVTSVCFLNGCVPCWWSCCFDNKRLKEDLHKKFSKCFRARLRYNPWGFCLSIPFPTIWLVYRVLQSFPGFFSYLLYIRRIPCIRILVPHKE